MPLVLISFLAGALTVLAPCVLPLLPVIIGGTLSGSKTSKSRPYLIAGGLIGSLVAFTLLLKASTALINVPPKVWAGLSGGVIILLGLVSLFPQIWDQFMARTGLQAAAQRFLAKGSRQRSQFLGPLVIGVALGPVFSSCSPTYAFIVASVLPRSLGSGLGYIAAYCLGLAAVLLFVAVFGQRLIRRFGWASDPAGWFRRALGVLFILVGLMIILGLDKKTELWLANHVPLSSSAIEQKLFNNRRDAAPSLVGKPSIKTPAANDSPVFNVHDVVNAPEFAGLGSWINSPPLTIASLKGKVVLVDFWTYSCINCLRTLPYVERWYQTYHNHGFVVVGVHTPEFSFEHLEKNVRQAAKDQKLTYPIALDNDYGTWNAYENQYWPAHYLIDQSGHIRQVHFGEGGYAETESAIQLLLGQQGRVTPDADAPQAIDTTPETYFGLERAKNFAGPGMLASGINDYQSAPNLTVHHWSLDGSWDVAPEKITSRTAGSLTFHVKAKDVYVVASNEAAPAAMKVTISGTDSTAYGADDPGGQAEINSSQLYHIASLPKYGEATITLSVPAGASLYTFTFGN